jgi:hypothetical protein
MKQLLMIGRDEHVQLKAGEVLQLTDRILVCLEGAFKIDSASKVGRPIKNPNGSAQTWTCPECDHAPFHAYTSYWYHLERTHGKARPQLRHRKAKTLAIPDAWRSEKADGKYPCPWKCGKVFNSANAWGPHKKGCPKVKP